MSNSTKEIWKPVKGYEGYYEVSNLGRVKSLDRIVISETSVVKRRVMKGKVMRMFHNSDGYNTLSLSKCGVPKTHSVHRLVGLAFIDNPEHKAEINHKDSVRDNNHVENLEWVSISENVQHMYSVARYQHSRSIPIRCLTLNVEKPSIIDMSRHLFALGIGGKHSHVNLSLYAREKKSPWKYKGLMFEVIE